MSNHTVPTRPGDRNADGATTGTALALRATRAEAVLQRLADVLARGNDPTAALPFAVLCADVEGYQRRIDSDGLTLEAIETAVDDLAAEGRVRLEARRGEVIVHLVERVRIDLPLPPKRPPPSPFSPRPKAPVCEKTPRASRGVP